MLEKRILGHQNRLVGVNTPVSPSYMSAPEKQKHIIKWFLVVSMVALLGVFGVLQFLKNKKFIIQHVSIQGVRTVDMHTVTDIVDQYFYRPGLLGIPSGNTMLFNKQKLANVLLDNFASFKNVQVAFTQPYEITITVDEYTPTYLWCNQYQQCLFANADGYMYKYSNMFTEGSFPIFYGSLQKPDFELRNTIFSSVEQYTFFKTVDDIIKKHNSNIVATSGINNASIVFHVDRLYGNVLTTYADIRIDNTISGEYFNNMMEILSRDIAFQNALSGGNVLDYIDLRYPEKIFYKFKTRPQIGVTTDTQ
jgi:hypothetical protein